MSPAEETVFDLIRRRPLICRKEIAKLLDLDRSTVTRQIRRLIDNGLVREAAWGTAGSRGGRRPIFLEMNPNDGLTVGVELSENAYRAVTLDPSGAVRGVETGRLDSALPPLEMLALLVRRLDAAGLIDPNLIAIGLIRREGDAVQQEGGAVRRHDGAPGFADFVLKLDGGRAVPVYWIDAAEADDRYRFPTGGERSSAVSGRACGAAASAFRRIGEAIAAGPQRRTRADCLRRVG